MIQFQFQAETIRRLLAEFGDREGWRANQTSDGVVIDCEDDELTEELKRRGLFIIGLLQSEARRDLRAAAHWPPWRGWDEERRLLAARSTR